MYAAYQARHDGPDFSFDGRDDTTGILSTFNPGTTPPVATAETLEDLRLRARAHLGEFPDDLLYLTDADRRVYEIIINRKYHQVTSASWRQTAIAVVLLFFCATCLIAAAFGFPASWAVGGFAIASALYAAILRMGLFNEIEGAVICEILLILCITTTAAIRDLTAE